VTDALVVLGLLDPHFFFGGRKELNRARAEAAIAERIGWPLGLDTREAAAGIYEIVTAKMSDLIRKVTVESGYDPREFVLFAYGGAGPAHAALYAEALGVREVIVPQTASVFSALGCALSDIVYTYAKSEPMLLEPDPAMIDAFNAVYRELERQALADMQASSFAAEEVRFSRKLDVRYEGQMSEMTINWPEPVLTAENLPRIRAIFEDIYELRFGKGTSRAESPMELMALRLEALKATDKPRLRFEPEGPADPSAARKGSREVYLRGLGAMQAAVYDGNRLAPGHVLEGPSIVERTDTTIFVPSGHEARMDGYHSLRVKSEE
jgi:N-methylhydantoinase A